MAEFQTTHCPYCGVLPAGHRDGGLSNAQPSAGDASMCIHCGELSVFGDDLVRRKATADELASMLMEAPLLIATMRENVDEYRRTGRRPWMPEEWD